MRDPPNTKYFIINEVNNLELMDVQEMDAKEMKNIEGGWWGRVVDSGGIYFINYSTGEVYNMAGQVVYKYMCYD